MASQSPGIGTVAAPSPLVSPPMLSSRIEVNVTGFPCVPLTVRLTGKPLVPETSMPAWLYGGHVANLTIVPG